MLAVRAKPVVYGGDGCGFGCGKKCQGQQRGPETLEAARIWSLQPSRVQSFRVKGSSKVATFHGSQISIPRFHKSKVLGVGDGNFIVAGLFGFNMSIEARLTTKRGLATDLKRKGEGRLETNDEERRETKEGYFLAFFWGGIFFGPGSWWLRGSWWLLVAPVAPGGSGGSWWLLWLLRLLWLLWLLAPMAYLSSIDQSISEACSPGACCALDTHPSISISIYIYIERPTAC